MYRVLNKLSENICFYISKKREISSTFCLFLILSKTSSVPSMGYLLAIVESFIRVTDTLNTKNVEERLTYFNKKHFRRQ